MNVTCVKFDDLIVNVEISLLLDNDEAQNISFFMLTKVKTIFINNGHEKPTEFA